MQKKIITPQKRNPQKKVSINKKHLYELVFGIYIFGIDDPNEINKVKTIISHISCYLYINLGPRLFTLPGNIITSYYWQQFG